MGGADKGLLPFQGRPLVAHVIERLAPQVDYLLISANRNLAAYRAFMYPVLRDQPDDPADETALPTPAAAERQRGPLAGLQAGLAACTTPWLITCPCDCPALPSDIVDRLLTAAKAQNARIAVASVAERRQPTFQLCHRKLLPALEHYLSVGGRKVGGWCSEQNALVVNFPDPGAFANLNRPEDLVLPAAE